MKKNKFGPSTTNPFKEKLDVFSVLENKQYNSEERRKIKDAIVYFHEKTDKRFKIKTVDDNLIKIWRIN